MRIKRIRIENYRSIKACDFAPSREMAAGGANPPQDREPAQCATPSSNPPSLRSLKRSLPTSDLCWGFVIQDLITALNTGCLRSRDGAILQRSKGKAFLTNPKWRNQMDTIVDLLRAIRSRYSTAVAAGEIVTEGGSGKARYRINKREIAEWMDATRTEVLRLFAELCGEAGVQAPIFPRFPHRHW